MERDEFFSRFGVVPKKANDPLRLGRSRRRKLISVTALAVGALALTLMIEKGSTYPGQQMLRSYVIERGENFDFRNIIPCATVVFFTSGTGGTTATLLPGWNNSINTVECIGGGGNGGTSTGVCCFNNMGFGGGGGGYNKSTNVTLGSTFTCAIGAASGTTSFNGGTAATGGTAGTTAAAGAGGTGLRTGGAGGGGGNSGNGHGSGGGGGAAGPSAAGGNGATPSTGSGGAGGAGDGGAGGAGGGQSTAGGTGNEYGTSHGSGGGGGGSAFGFTAGGAGGLYGGAGAGGSPAGAGKQGLIVATYTPASGGTLTIFPNLPMGGF